jgi:predicted lipoprotein with Yx(FWY)xxD motif
MLKTAGGTDYLTDSKGMTLYYYTKDTDGQSACYGGCATAWPIFYAENLTLPSSLKASDFGTVTRTDGTKQTTYMGWPLYYWQRDTKAGDMTGEGVGKVWYILGAAYNVMASQRDRQLPVTAATRRTGTQGQRRMSACSATASRTGLLHGPSSFLAPNAATSARSG